MNNFEKRFLIIGGSIIAIISFLVLLFTPTSTKNLSLGSDNVWNDYPIGYKIPDDIEIKKNIYLKDDSSIVKNSPQGFLTVAFGASIRGYVNPKKNSVVQVSIKTIKDNPIVKDGYCKPLDKFSYNPGYSDNPDEQFLYRCSHDLIKHKSPDGKPYPVKFEIWHEVDNKKVLLAQDYFMITPWER